MSKQSRGRDKFNKFKPIIIMLSKSCILLPKRLRIILFEHYRMTRGIIGLVLRYVLLKSVALQCGDNVSIHPGVYLFRPENLSIGNNVSIHPMCYIDATGEIGIGNNVSIAHGVTILSTSHVYTAMNIPIKDQGIEEKKTTIHDDVWIGAKATILYGVNLRQGSIIAANCVVIKDVNENMICVGIPGKEIKKRL